MSESSPRKKIDRDLVRVIHVGSGLSLGLMASFLYSVKVVTPELRCELSFGTAGAFVVAAAFSSVFWHVALKGGVAAKAASAVRHRWQQWFVALSITLTVATLVAFGFALRGVGASKLREIVQGTAAAFLALSAVGFIFWRVARFLDRDSKRASPPRAENDDADSEGN